MALGNLDAFTSAICILIATQACGVAAFSSNVLASSSYATHEILRRHNPLGYVASNTLTAIALTLILLVAFSQTYCMYKWGPKWMLALVIGEYCFALGFALRFAVHSNPNSISLYAIQNLFVILSPCAFIAADYVLLGRLTVYLGAEKYLVISPLKITRYFVVSDVLTFLVQAAGGGLSASASGSTLGARIFLAGLILQLVSFAVFIVIYGIFLQRVHKDSRLWGRDGSEAWYNDWRALAGALCVSCCGILIRSFYRVIELSQGYQGYFATTEGYFYGLDTLPLLIAIVIYTPFWPGRFIAASYHYDGNIHLDRVGS